MIKLPKKYSKKSHVVGTEAGINVAKFNYKELTKQSVTVELPGDRDFNHLFFQGFMYYLVSKKKMNPKKVKFKGNFSPVTLAAIERQGLAVAKPRAKKAVVEA